jgi:hypothetical protein
MKYKPMPPDRIHHHRRRSASCACCIACAAASLALISTRGVKSSDRAHLRSVRLSCAAGERADGVSCDAEKMGSARAWAANPRRGSRLRRALSRGKCRALALRRWTCAGAAAVDDRSRLVAPISCGSFDIALVAQPPREAETEDKRVARSAVAGAAARRNRLSSGCSRHRRARWRRCVSRRGIRRWGSMPVGARRGGEGRAERMVLRGAQQPRTIHWRLRSMENAAENVSVYI